MTVKFDLYLESLSSANHLSERNIRLKFNKIHGKGSCEPMACQFGPKFGASWLGINESRYICNINTY